MNKNKKFNKISQEIKNSNNYNQISKLLYKNIIMLNDIEIKEIKNKNIYLNLLISLDDSKPVQGECLVKLSIIIYRFVEHNPQIIEEKHMDKINMYLYSDDICAAGTGLSILYSLSNNRPELINSDLIDDIKETSNESFLPHEKIISDSILSIIDQN